ncbi:hypothetical protein HYALB_00002923 [Hymenoscyphus albidus]|uniref:RING-type domain-containing protein n=1 Tax=Hymenoscyphus albidus TaxID=595503 RepID=A0A9N9QCX7_9HELO|nr:hypothetical protein HYALB_00002923 [Hymenoscyphus albidus]
MCYTVTVTFACGHQHDFTTDCENSFLLSAYEECPSFWESSRPSCSFTCDECIKEGDIGDMIIFDAFSQSVPNHKELAHDLAERFSLFWQEVEDNNWVSQLKFRTGSEQESPLDSYLAQENVIKTEELVWLIDSHLSTILSIRALVLDRHAHQVSDDEIQTSQDELEKLSKLLGFQPSFFVKILVRKVIYAMQRQTMVETSPSTFDPRNMTPPVAYEVRTEEFLQMSPYACPICQDNIGETIVLGDREVAMAERPLRMLCGHIFGHLCIEGWFRACEVSEEIPNCPLCRRTFPPEYEEEPDETEEPTSWWWIEMLRGTAPLVRDWDTWEPSVNNSESGDLDDGR